MSKYLFMLCALALGFSGPARAAENPLYEELSRANEVKIFVATPADAAGTKIDPEAFKASLEKALRERRSIHFLLAPESDARLVVETEIKGYTFSETDPVDMLVGAAAIALDAAKQEPFAALEARMTLKEGGRVRWTDAVRASVTEEKMDEAAARQKVADKAAQMFVRQAFGKKK